MFARGALSRDNDGKVINLCKFIRKLPIQFNDLADESILYYAPMGILSLEAFNGRDKIHLEQRTIDRSNRMPLKQV